MWHSDIRAVVCVPRDSNSVGGELFVKSDLIYESKGRVQFHRTLFQPEAWNVWRYEWPGCFEVRRSARHSVAVPSLALKFLAYRDNFHIDESPYSWDFGNNFRNNHNSMRQRRALKQGILIKSCKIRESTVLLHLHSPARCNSDERTLFLDEL